MAQIKRIVLLSSLLLIFLSCSKEIHIEIENDNFYHLVIKNGTHDDVYVICKQLSESVGSLATMCKSDTLSTSSERVAIQYFGKGTYNKEKWKDVVLKKYEVTSITLDN